MGSFDGIRRTLSRQTPSSFFASTSTSPLKAEFISRGVGDVAGDVADDDERAARRKEDEKKRHEEKETERRERERTR